MLLLRSRQVTIDISPGMKDNFELNLETSHRAGVLIIALLSAVSFKCFDYSLDISIDGFCLGSLHSLYCWFIHVQALFW